MHSSGLYCYSYKFHVKLYQYDFRYQYFANDKTQLIYSGTFGSHKNDKKKKSRNQPKGFGNICLKKREEHSISIR